MRAAPPVVQKGKITTFRFYLNNAPVQAARWRWIPQSASWDSVAGCPTNVTLCRRAMFNAGTMWAYSSSSPGGDSAQAAVDVTIGVPPGGAPDTTELDTIPKVK